MVTNIGMMLLPETNLLMMIFSIKVAELRH